MSFPTFSDFDKAPNDIFKKDFDTETVVLKIKTKGPEDLTINSKVDFFSLKNLKSSVAVDKKFNKFKLDKFEIKSGAVAIETALDAFDGLKLEFKGDDRSKGDLSALYKTAAATITAEADIVSFNSANASISSGYGPLALGGRGALESKDGKITLKDFSLGVGYSVPKTLFVGVRANKKISEFGANMLYNINKDVTVAAAATYPKTSMKFGATYKCNPKTALKFKLDTGGELGASAKHSWNASTTITGAALVNVNNLSAYKLGLTASLE